MSKPKVSDTEASRVCRGRKTEQVHQTKQCRVQREGGDFKPPPRRGACLISSASESGGDPHCTPLFPLVCESGSQDDRLTEAPGTHR